MVTFPNAKINIGLSVTGKRPDGYHNIESIFYPVPCTDILEGGIFKTESDFIQFYGLPIEGDPASNLVAKAAGILEDYLKKNGTQSEILSRFKKVKFYLYKKIPSGAGLGGGSSDGVFALKIYNEILRLNLTESVLEELALAIGSDCPFFIGNKPSLVSGRGEILEPIQLDLKGYFLTLIHPGIHVSTAAAYSAITPEKSNFNYATISSIPLTQWKDVLRNDFEKSVFGKHPEIARIKSCCYEKGAIYAQMSGSGSAVFTISDTEEKARIIAEEVNGEGFQNFYFSL